MTIKVELEVYPSRYGFLVTPFLVKVGFDYNTLYVSKDDVIRDFKLRGWSLVERKKNTLSKILDSEFFTFQKEV